MSGLGPGSQETIIAVASVRVGITSQETLHRLQVLRRLLANISRVAWWRSSRCRPAWALLRIVCRAGSHNWFRSWAHHHWSWSRFFPGRCSRSFIPASRLSFFAFLFLTWHHLVIRGDPFSKSIQLFITDQRLQVELLTSHSSSRSLHFRLLQMGGSWPFNFELRSGGLCNNLLETFQLFWGSNRLSNRLSNWARSHLSQILAFFRVEWSNLCLKRIQLSLQVDNLELFVRHSGRSCLFFLLCIEQLLQHEKFLRR